MFTFVPVASGALAGAMCGPLLLGAKRPVGAFGAGLLCVLIAYVLIAGGVSLAGRLLGWIAELDYLVEPEFTLYFLYSVVLTGWLTFPLGAGLAVTLWKRWQKEDALRDGARAPLHD